MANFPSAGRHHVRAVFSPLGSLVRAISPTTQTLVTVAVPAKFLRMRALPVKPSKIVDINRDGILDLLGGIPNGVDVFTPAITVHIGIGGGLFGAAIPSALPLATGPLGDFDGDGKLDMAAQGGYYPGNGNESFATQLISSPNVFPGWRLTATSTAS